VTKTAKMTKIASATPTASTTIIVKQRETETCDRVHGEELGRAREGRGRVDGGQVNDDLVGEAVADVDGSV